MDELRTAIVLHELSHMTGALGDDRNWTTDQFLANIDLITQYCLR
jgi:hypothetical protein